MEAKQNRSETIEQELAYGIVKEYKNGTVLWFEPITDILDGFVLRDSKGEILSVFSEDQPTKA